MSTFFNDASFGTGFEPKRQHRWIVQFPALSGIEFLATEVKKPAVKMETTKHEFLNHKFKFPGKVDWQPIEVTFLDAFEPNVGSSFYNALLDAGYRQPSGFSQSLAGFTKQANTAALGGTVFLFQLDGGASVTIPGSSLVVPKKREEWRIVNPIITGITWGETMKYEGAEMVNVKVSLDYDYAEASFGDLGPYEGSG
jgi:hypothetical protein